MVKTFRSNESRDNINSGSDHSSSEISSSDENVHHGSSDENMHHVLPEEENIALPEQENIAPPRDPGAVKSAKMTAIDLAVSFAIFATLSIVYAIEPDFKDCKPGLHNIVSMIC